jgi:hypothetical protein
MARERRVTQQRVGSIHRCEPRGWVPGFPRPLPILQSDAFDRSRLRTVIADPDRSSSIDRLAFQERLEPWLRA